MPEPRKTKTRDAQKTKNKILEAAKAAFSKNSYEQLGVREIARLADVDAALVYRYFGSKMNLFKEVAEEIFKDHRYRQYTLENYPQIVMEHLQAELFTKDDRKSNFDPFQVMLRSAVSPLASPILAKMMDEVFIGALAQKFSGPQSQLKAGLINAYIFGLITFIEAFKLPYLDMEQNYETISGSSG